MDFKYQKILWEIESYLEQQSLIKSQYKLEYSSILRESFWIEENIGNNSFSYYSGKKIFAPAVVIGDIDDIQEGNKIVFEDENISSTGLKNYIGGYTQNTQTPIFLCDNHNSVLEAWELVKNDQLTLVHIDQHRDDAKYLSFPRRRESRIKNNSIFSTKICDYIDFTLKNSWIQQKYYSFIEASDLLKKEIKEGENYILNIDLDFFALEHTTLTFQEKLDLILFYLPQTKIITLATSPLFIDQEFAREIAKLFWKYL